MDSTEPEKPHRFVEVYGLKEGEPFRWVSPPFIAQRMEWYRKRDPIQADSVREGPQVMQISWRDGQPQADMQAFGRIDVRFIIRHFLGVFPQEIEGDALLAGHPVKGDLVVNGPVLPEDSHAMVEKIIGEVAGSPVGLTFREVERPAIVFRGQWRASDVTGTALPNGREIHPIDIFGENLSDPVVRTQSGAIKQFARSLGEWINKPIVLEAIGAPSELIWRLHHLRQGTREAVAKCRDPQLVCKHIEDQTGLQSAEEVQCLRQLFIERRATSA